MTKQLRLATKSPHPTPKRCRFALQQAINAPLPVVWSVLRQFDNPQAYKPFIKSCTVVHSGGPTTSRVRSITHITGFPTRTSVERLDRLDDEAHVVVFSLVGGDHAARLPNYREVVSAREGEAGGTTTVVTEEYAVDVAGDSCEEDTRVFVDTLVRLNLKSLARVAEAMATSTSPLAQRQRVRV